MFDLKTEIKLNDSYNTITYYSLEEKNKIIFKSHYHNFLNKDVRKPRFVPVSNKEWKTIHNICKYIFSVGEIAIHFNFYFPSQKWIVSDIVRALLYKLKEGCSFKSLEKIFGISHSTLSNSFSVLQKFNVFSLSYSKLLKKYYGRRFIDKLKYRLTDTSSVVNKGCTEEVNYNKYYGRKKISKISTETDSDGIAIGLKIVAGNVTDNKIYRQQVFEERFIDEKMDIETRKYLLADSGYDDKETLSTIRENNFTPIVRQNKRNIKDRNKIREMTKYETKIYKKRIKIENSYCTMKKNKDINAIYYKKINSFKNMVILSFIYNLTSILENNEEDKIK